MLSRKTRKLAWHFICSMCRYIKQIGSLASRLADDSSDSVSICKMGSIWQRKLWQMGVVSVINFGWKQLAIISSLLYSSLCWIQHDLLLFLQLEGRGRCGLVVRLYEAYGSRAAAKLSCYSMLKYQRYYDNNDASSWEHYSYLGVLFFFFFALFRCNLLEEPEEELQGDEMIQLTLAPFEVVSYVIVTNL